MHARGQSVCAFVQTACRGGRRDGRSHLCHNSRMLRSLFFIPVLVTAALLYAAANGTREISMADLRDKIEGGWAGQMIGVTFGAPTECKYRQKMIEDELPKWTPDHVSNAIVQDDLYVDMAFAK